MAEQDDSIADPTSGSTWQTCAEMLLLVTLFFVYAGDLPPMVNEAHYLVKAKNFWQPDWCQADLFAASGKEHTTFYVLFCWPTQFVSLEATAWIGRVVGWCMLAFGLLRLTRTLIPQRYAALGVAVAWIAGVEYGNLAGEWVVGGIEAKVPAYGLVLLGLAELVHRRWRRVWIYLGAASAFHVLTGGWSVIAAMIAWWAGERKRVDAVPLFTPALFLGGAIALFGLVPAAMLTIGASSEDSAAAAKIYSYMRIRHHLLPADFNGEWYLRHGVLLVVTFVLASSCWRDLRIRSLGWFTIGAVMIAGVGLLVGLLPAVMPDLAAKLLRYYWFRLTDAIVPLLFGILIVRYVLDSHHTRKCVGIALLMIATLLVGFSSYQNTRSSVPPSASNSLLGIDLTASAEVEQQVFRDWLAVCRWAKWSSGPDEVFLTPRHQQTFKWYAERAEVVNWKDVPQDATSLREWSRRFQEIFPPRLGSTRVTIQYASLRQYRAQYGVRYLIVDQRVVGRNLPLVRIYPTSYETNDTFAVYEMPTLVDSDRSE
jgi:hypothetical protein